MEDEEPDYQTTQRLTNRFALGEIDGSFLVVGLLFNPQRTKGTRMKRIGIVCAVLACVATGCATWTGADGTQYQSYWSAMTPSITKVTLPNGDVQFFAGGSILNQSAGIVAQAVRRPNRTNIVTYNRNNNDNDNDNNQSQDQEQDQEQYQDQYQDQYQEQDQDQEQYQDQDQEQSQDGDDDSGDPCLGC